MSSRGQRVLSGLAVLVLVLVVCALGILFWPAPAARAVAAQPATPDLVTRGQYLATAADCVACHTTAGGAPYAGGRAFKLPFGTIYSPNITPDRETGIGAWSDAEFLRAVHKGVGRQGEELYPAFPYTSYARMTDGDALAIKAYLFSLPAIHAPAHPNGLAFPFNQRPLMRFWKTLFMPRGDFQPDPHRPADWNRGAYLVTALGHCGECHTPRNLLYGLKSGQSLAGETMQGWTAWNISSDPHHGIGAWSQADLVAYLGQGYAIGHGAASGPMKEAVDYSLSKLTPKDLAAIAVYLKATPPRTAGPTVGDVPAALAASTLTGPGSSESDSPGRRIFEGACASCHAWNGQGQQVSIAALGGLNAVRDPNGVNVVQTVLRGGGVTTPEGQAFMPAFGHAYSDAEIAAVSNYVTGHFGGVAGKVTPRQVSKARLD